MSKYQLLGAVLLLCAFVLTLLASISLPYLPTLDITHVNLENRAVVIIDGAPNELLLGVWTFCYYTFNWDLECAPIGSGYSVPANDWAVGKDISISSPWTSGLVFHPVTAVVTIVAFVFSVVPATYGMVVVCVPAFISVLVCLIAFVLDIVLFVYIQSQFSGDAVTGPGLWINFTAMILAGIASCSLFIGSRQHEEARFRLQ